MCPAIHISSRSWLRSSSTHEPSDPPLRIVLNSFFLSRPFSPGEGGKKRRSSEETDCYWKENEGRRNRRESGAASGAAPSKPRDPPRVSPATGLGARRQRPLPVVRGGTLPGLDAAADQVCTQARPGGRALPRSQAEGPRRRRCFRNETLMILPQVHLRKPCYDFYFL